MKNLRIVTLSTLLIVSVLSCNRPEEYNIGVILPLTGPFAEYGIPEKNGMILAVNEINKNGGIRGKTLNLIFEDDASVSKNAISSANKLISIDRVKVIIGPLSSSNALAVAPVCEKNRVIQISTLAGIPELTNAGDYIFRIYPSSAVGAKYTVEKAIEKFRPNKVAILYPSNPFGEVSKNIYEEFCKKNGIYVSAIESYIDGTSDFRTQMAKISYSKPDLILCSAYWMDGANIIKQMIELNVNVPIIGEDGWRGPIFKLVGSKGIRNLYFADILFGKGLSDDVNMLSFIEMYYKKYNETPNTAASAGFDAINLVAKAIKSKNYNAEEIKTYLYNNSYQGSLGKIMFDKNGDNIGLSFGLFQMDSLNNVILILK